MEPDPLTPDPESLPASRFYPANLLQGKWSVILFFTVVSLEALTFYLNQYARWEWINVGFTALIAIVLLFILPAGWAGLWALIGRVFRRQAFYWGHFNITMTAALLLLVLSAAVTLIQFSLNAETSGFLLNSLVLLLLGLWGFTGHLRLAFRAPLRKLATVSGILLGSLMGLWILFLSLLVQKIPSLKTAQMTLLPPFLLAARPVTVEAHLKSLDDLQVKVDKRAKKLAEKNKD